MNRLRLVLEVARWELRRFTSVRQQVGTFVVTCLLLGSIAALVSVALPNGMPAMANASQASRLSTGIVVGFVEMFMLLGMFIGYSNLLAGITGEKRLRVTEVVLSAIPARTWMDGKLIGLGAVSVMSAGNLTLATAVVFTVVRARTIGGASMVAEAGVEWQVVAPLLVVAVLGFLFWFTVFAAIAATIDDPNSSSRQLAIYLPFVPAALSVPVVLAPQTTLATVLTLIPPTAPFVLPVRLVSSSVSSSEIWASIVILAIATIALRGLAVRVFGLGVLMYGKEASWREVRRWMRVA